MERYVVDGGILELEVVPNYRLNEDTEVVAFARVLKKVNSEETLITYYDERSNFIGLSYVSRFKGKDQVIFNGRYDNNGISYEYSYRAYDKKYYTITGVCGDNDFDKSVIIEDGKSERLFRKYVDDDGQIIYVFSDGKDINSDGYKIIISHNEEDNETNYGLYGDKYSFEFSEARDQDEIIENLYNDNGVIFMYDGHNVYRGSEIGEDGECLDDGAIEYEEVDIDERYYYGSKHGPIYNMQVKKYIDYIDFFINTSRKKFPGIPESIVSFDIQYFKDVRDIYPDIDFSKLLIGDGKKSLDNVVSGIITKARGKNNKVN